jgi:phosphate-selective porin OprO and OprP
VLSYAVGIFNGVGDGQRNTSNTAFQDNREFDGDCLCSRSKQPAIAALQNLGIGVGGSWGTSSITNTLGLPNTTGGTLPGFYTDGQQQFFAYNPATGGVWPTARTGVFRPRVLLLRPVWFAGRICDFRSGVKNSATLQTADLKNTAWEISGGWVLTGEDATFNGVTPRHPFDPRNGGWGALQLVARYAELDVDKAAFPVFANPATSASEAHAWAIGLNWYLNSNIRVNASFSRTTFTGGGGAGTTVPAAVTQHPKMSSSPESNCRFRLTQQQLWPAIEPKVVPTENVRAALAAVESGNVEAGVVYKTDAGISKKVKVAYEVPARTRRTSVIRWRW